MRSINKIFFYTTAFTLALIVARFVYTGNHVYVFLLWNLFLAWIPLFISYQLSSRLERRAWNILVFAGWLLFFPNSLYIVTDLVHLNHRSDAPEWFDIILLFSAVMNGLMMAYASIVKIHLFLRDYFSDRFVNLIILVCFTISSFGVYLGRFLRWNSWDAVTKPGIIINELFIRLFAPMRHPAAWGMTLLLSVFFAMLYFVIRKLPGLTSGKN